MVRSYDPSAVLQTAFRRFFDHIQIDEAWLSIVRDAAGRGPVVYVMRNLSFLDFMALDHLTERYGLPGVRFANDLGLWVLEPFAETWTQAVLQSRRTPPTERMSDVISSGGSAVLFLKRPPTLLEKAAHSRRRAVSSEGDALVKTLFDLQGRMDRPIMLVPQVFVWSKRPERLEPSLIDFVLGPRDWPGRIRLAAEFLLNYRNVLLRAGEPIALTQFLQANAGETQETLVRRGTYALLRKIERERRAVLGPMRKPADRVREEIVRSPKLTHAIRQLAGEGRAERMLLTARAYRMLRELEAAPDPETIVAMSTAIQGILNVLYAGLEIDKEGIERVRQAAQRGTLVFLPSHKSHIDYLLLSHVLQKHSLQLPLIAAGDNLSFFPAGPIFRRGGAFFIRRSFHGDRLYAAVVDAYLRRVLRDGWPIEVFIEGTRSRTGKLLPPKLGLLNMLVDSGLSISNRDILFIPVSIGYERLVEEGSYVRELLGGEKRTEDTTALIRASAIFAERYGRLNIQFGEALSLRQLMQETGLREGDRVTPARRRELTKKIAYQALGRINAVTAATPGAIVALALLTHGKRGLTHSELLERSRQLLVTLQRQGARCISSLVTPSGALRPASIREAAKMFQKAKLVQVHIAADSLVGKRVKTSAKTDQDIVYTVPDDKRIALDISKNIIIHFFVPFALIAIAMLAPPGPPCDLASVRERVERLSKLFKHEFMFSRDKGFDEIFDDTLRSMALAHEIRVEDNQLSFGEGHDGATGRAWLVWYGSMLRNFLEAYVVSARSL
ncbi:MAG TPA: 1-acyl-sn-glycerol-3-phosphate acyltransferase, partial [Polyangiaceae bacterium]|nr:1-acyl-sn-glycerol-3-phosphate acyltransferase [Polyangiaceae bacterium]